MNEVANTPAPTPPGWAEAVRAVVGAIRNGALGPGEVAALRRERPDTPQSPAFWRALATYIEPRWGVPRDPTRRQRAEFRWAVVLSNVARLPAAGDHPAKALADADYSEIRFLRLLRASGPELARQVRAAVTFLAAKGFGIDWVPMAALVLADPEDHPEWAEQVRRDFARRFFQTYPQNSENPNQPKED